MKVRIECVPCGVAAAVVLAALITAGCGKPATPKGPSYAEALAIYNDEVDALDRLKEQRAKLQELLDRPPQASTLDVAEQLLGNTSALSKELSGALEDLGGPGSPLGGEEARRRQDELIGSVTEQIQEAKAAGQDRAEQWKGKAKEIEAKIADLDKQIAAQQQRVERALADKDAAESCALVRSILV